MSQRHEDDIKDGTEWSTSVCTDDLEQPAVIFSGSSDGLFQFLAIFSFSVFVGLFLIQANMAWQSYQVLQRLSRQGSAPDMVYHLYFDYLDWEIDPSTVDMKANTTIFVH